MSDCSLEDVWKHLSNADPSYRRALVAKLVDCKELENDLNCDITLGEWLCQEHPQITGDVLCWSPNVKTMHVLLDHAPAHIFEDLSINSAATLQHAISLNSAVLVRRLTKLGAHLIDVGDQEVNALNTIETETSEEVKCALADHPEFSRAVNSDTPNSESEGATTTPLSFACEQDQDFTVIEWFLQHGADPCLPEEYSAVYWACNFYDDTLLKCLYPYIRGWPFKWEMIDSRSTPFEGACHAHNQDALRFLQDQIPACMPEHLLHIVLEHSHGDTNERREFLNGCCSLLPSTSLHFRHPRYGSPLLYALRLGRLEEITWLMAKSCKLGVSTSALSALERAVLAKAVRACQREAVKSHINSRDLNKVIVNMLDEHSQLDVLFMPSKKKFKISTA